jgi:NAD(P)-dependent dehydrogenase (short-subunit alcohol dehydrogenase family)|tara:strand:+ start:1108 stop:1788 length:681 start_codon:yes stop_codon:yes gene_type:complete
MMMSKILITGSKSGLGKAMREELESQGHEVFGYDMQDSCDVRNPDKSKLPEEIDVLINNAGVNIINWLEDFVEAEWDMVMDTNAKGIYMMSRACLPKLIESKGTIVNIVSNAAHMPMTCSLSYNASKAAAHIMTKQLARELTKKNGITVFGIAPNKMSGTGMSGSIDDQVVKTRGWSKEYAQEYQLNGLLTGEETPPGLLAEFIAYLLQDKDHHKFLTGCILPYGA